MTESPHDQPFNVLISSAGRRVALMGLFRHALDELGLTGSLLATDMSLLSSAFHAADLGFQVPPCRDVSFVPAMLAICREHHVRLIVPTIDPELPVYAEHREAFEAIGTTVAIGHPDVIAIGGTKDRTHEWLREQGFPTVRQTTVEGVAAEPERWPYPLIVKPVGGSGSIGVAVVQNAAELEVATREGRFVVQAVASGEEYTVDVYCDRNGHSRCAVPRKRLEVRAGEVSKGLTVRSTVLESLARQVCDALPGAFGALCVQIFYEASTRELNVIEINPRFGGGHPLACAAGANFPRWLIEEVLGRPSSARDDAWTDHLVMLRYDDAVFVAGADAGMPVEEGEK